MFEIFLCKFPKIIIYIWIQQLYFGKNQKYLWKRFYTVKNALKNRASVNKKNINIVTICFDLKIPRKESKKKKSCDFFL